VSAGRSLLGSAKEAVRLFAYKAGMKLIAASSDIDISALKNSVNVLAKLNITQTAETITLTAKQEILVNGGSSYTRWNAGGIVHGTNGIWREHAATHSLVGPKSVGVNVQGAPDISLYDETFKLLDPKGNPMAHIPYAVTGAGDAGHEARTTKSGETPRINTKSPEKLNFSLTWAEIDVDADAEKSPETTGKTRTA
jgi:type VI secretion system secreted protein VgrG